MNYENNMFNATNSRALTSPDKVPKLVYHSYNLPRFEKLSGTKLYRLRANPNVKKPIAINSRESVKRTHQNTENNTH